MPASPSVSSTEAAPARLGFRMPAEWEAQEAIWLSWPHRRASWPGRFRPIPSKFAQIAARLSRFEKVRCNLAEPLLKRARALIEAAGAAMANVEFFLHPTDDAWCRDHGPVFVKNDRTGEVAVLDWGFNAWGRKYPSWELDDQIPARVAAALGLRRFQPGIVLEGGSIDVNGKGAVLTTESCLLNPNRNPGLSREEIEAILRDFLGVSAVIWLGQGLAGDDTDGHVDDLSRFFSPTGVLTAVEASEGDANYRPLRENLERLRSWRNPAGEKLTVVELPMPAPCYGHGRRLPATYANFLAVNGAVLMPAFGQPARDAQAADVLRGCFPGREIVPIDCRDLVLGLGALHCISQQQPEGGG